MRRLTAIFAALVLALSLGAPAVRPATAATPCDQIEEQSWWSEDGIRLPDHVGQHVHLGLCWPTYGTILTGTVNVPVDVLLHAQPADAHGAYLRVGYTLNGVIFYKTTDVAIALDASGNGARSFVIPIDTTKLTTGSSEFRFTYDVRYTLNGQAREQFNTGGLQGCVRTCDGPDRSIPWTEVRSWYGKDAASITHNYQNVRIRTQLSTCLRVGGTCSVEMVPGSGGRPTVLSWAALDSRYHDGFGGTVLKMVGGSFKGTITIPPLPSGLHKLVLGASDGKNAVVGSFSFVVP